MDEVDHLGATSFVIDILSTIKDLYHFHVSSNLHSLDVLKNMEILQYM